MPPHLLPGTPNAQVMRSSDDQLREFLFQQMTVLVGTLRQHIRKYLPDILAMVHDFWGGQQAAQAAAVSPSAAPGGPLLSHILKLVSELAGACGKRSRNSCGVARAVMGMQVEGASLAWLRLHYFCPPHPSYPLCAPISSSPIHRHRPAPCTQWRCATTCVPTCLSCCHAS